MKFDIGDIIISKINKEIYIVLNIHDSLYELYSIRFQTTGVFITGMVDYMFRKINDLEKALYDV